MEPDLVRDQERPITDSTVFTKILDEVTKPILSRRWAKAFEHRFQKVSLIVATITGVWR